MSAPRPVPAVLAVILRGEEVLLVRRANPPDAGLWGFPGGKIELGETLGAAAEREAREETGVRCRAGAAFAALDAFHREDGALRAHYVMVAVTCAWLEGEPLAADDAAHALLSRYEAAGSDGTQRSLAKPSRARQSQYAEISTISGPWS